MPGDGLLNSLSTFKERNWNRLLDDIEAGQVIPIVGPELAVASFGPERSSLYRHVARMLAESLDEVDESVLAQNYGIGDVSAAMVRNYGELDDVYSEIRHIMREQEWPVPESLKHLAGIRHFDTFVSMTFDSLLEEAVRDVRGTDVESLAYSSLDQRVVDVDPRRAGRSTVYQMFGQLSHPPDYVVTEEDQLRFTHLLHSPDRRPVNLFDLMQSRKLLVIGCNFPNWLARFFLCCAKGDRLFYESLGSVFADGTSRHDENFVMFLERRKGQVYHQGDAVEFVSELYDRWTERFGGAELDGGVAENASISVAEPGETQDFAGDSVFLSYASEDRSAAQTIREQLARVGVDVWFDQGALEPGDHFKDKILRSIEQASVFLPLISQHTLTNERRFFRLEWKKAIEEADYRPDEPPFIQPVVIDTTDVEDGHVPAAFRTRHCVRLENGRATDAFLKLMVRTIRSVRRQQGD